MLAGAHMLMRSPNAPVFLATPHSAGLADSTRGLLEAAGYKCDTTEAGILGIPANLAAEAR